MCEHSTSEAPHTWGVVSYFALCTFEGCLTHVMYENRGGIAYTNESIQIELLFRPKHDVKLLFAPAPARNPFVIPRGGGGVGA